MQPFVRRVLAGSSTAALMGAAILAPVQAQAAGGPARVTVEKAPTWTSSARAKAGAPAHQRVSLSIVLNLRDEAGAEAAAVAASDPDSAHYRKFLTASAWRAKFAPTDATVAKVRKWLVANGFTVGAIPANHRMIAFSGTVAQAERAFATQLGQFSRYGAQVTAPVADASVPADLAGDVAGLTGLDTSAIVKPAHAGAERTASAPARATPTSTLPGPPAAFRNAPPCSHYYGEKPAPGYPQILADPLTYAPCGYTPGQLRSAYGTDAKLARGYDGRGATIAIVDAYAAPTIYHDASTYAQRNDPSHPLRKAQFRQLLPATFGHFDLCDPQGWYGEETLDVEAAHAMAPAANILYVGAASCLDDEMVAAVNSIVDNSLANVVSNSYGDSGELPRGVIAAEHQTYVQAAAQGISMVFSSGDSGDEIAGTGERQPDYPASDPWVTGVGGTSLAVGKRGQYLFEQGWGTVRYTLTDGKWTNPTYLYGSGGGTSHVFRQPWYQRDVVPSGIAHHNGTKAMRSVPDVAMVGDPNTGFLVGETQTFPNGRVKYSEYRIGGTSLSAPLYAGVTAVADQVAGGSLGFLNPRLYKLAGSDAFRDVDHGRKVTDGVVRVDYANAVNASDGLVTSLRTFNDTGTIFTRPGYDDVTGVGSPNGTAYLNAMAGRFRP